MSHSLQRVCRVGGHSDSVLCCTASTEQGLLASGGEVGWRAGGPGRGCWGGLCVAFFSADISPILIVKN